MQMTRVTTHYSGERQGAIAFDHKLSLNRGSLNATVALMINVWAATGELILLFQVT